MTLTTAMTFICRRVRREDIAATKRLWDQDRPLYDPEVWLRLPEILAGLLERELVTLVAVESIPDGIPRILCGISFVRPEIIAEASGSGDSLPNFAARAALAGCKPFLTPKEVAVANAAGELNLVNFLGAIDRGLDQHNLAACYDIAHSGYRFFHVGYSFRALWTEVCTDYQRADLQEQGMLVERTRTLPGNRTSTLFRLTREEARASPYTRLSGLMLTPRPVFHFSFAEQRLLEYALLEFSDEEAAGELYLTPDAVKKRWRSIYEKVAAANPALLGARDSGTARRRKLLRYLRHNLVELRPYRR